MADDTGGAIEYRFELKNTAIQPDWILLSDYNSTENLSWNSSSSVGKNKIRVSARRAGSLDLAIKDIVTIWINPIDAVTSVLITPSVFSPQPSGTGITFSTSATGGNGSIEYRFSVKDTALAIGLFIGMFQAATSINEQTLSFIPKLGVLLLSILVAGPWMLNLLLSFTRRLYLSIPGLECMWSVCPEVGIG